MLRDEIIPFIGKLVKVFDTDDTDSWYCGWLALNKKTDEICLGNGPRITPAPIIEDNYQICFIKCKDIKTIEETTVKEEEYKLIAVKYISPTWEYWKSFDGKFTHPFSKEDWYTGNNQRRGYGNKSPWEWL